MMSGVPDVVRSLFMPLAKDGVLLPIAAVAEIVAYGEPTPYAPADVPLGAGSGVVLGSMRWRERTVAVCSLEAAIGQRFAPPGARGRIVVLHGLSDDRVLPYLAVAIQNLPTMIPASSASVHWIPDKLARPELSREMDGDAGAASACIAGWVEAGGRDAWIPDLSAIEALVARQIDSD